MKKLAALILVLFGVLQPYNSDAQTGWKWGVGSIAHFSTACEAGVTATDPMGNVFVAGYINGWADTTRFGSFLVYKSPTDLQAILAKTDSMGNYQWVIGTNCHYAAPTNIVTDSSGNVYMMGSYYDATMTFGSVTFNNPTMTFMAFIAKISPTGNVLWGQNLTRDTSFDSYAGGGGLGIDKARNIYLTGAFNGPSATIGTTTLINSGTTPGHPQPYIAKYDSAGNSIWAKKYGGRSSAYPTAITVGVNGNFDISGRYYTDSFVAGSTVLTNYPSSFLTKFDSSGSALWVKNINEYITVHSLAQDDSEHVYFTGELDTNIVLAIDTLSYGGGGADFIIGRYNSDGTYGWARTANGGKKEMGYSIAADHCGHLWACANLGPLTGYVWFDAIHSASAPPFSDDPMFLAEYDRNGNYITSISLPTGGDDAMGLTVDGRGNVYVAGDYMSTYTGHPFVLGPDTFFYPAPEQMFLGKYRYDTELCVLPLPLISPLPISQAVTGTVLYPNPGGDMLTISADTDISEVAVFNAMGQTLFVKQYGTREAQVDVRLLPAGIYFVRVNGTEIHKFVKQ